MKYTVEMSNKLNELLERTYDAEKGFKQAADKVDNKTIKQFFLDSHNQRENFGKELKAEIMSFGEQPEDSGSTKGSIHRSWINFKSVFRKWSHARSEWSAITVDLYFLSKSRPGTVDGFYLKVAIRLEVVVFKKRVLDGNN